MTAARPIRGAAAGIRPSDKLGHYARVDAYGEDGGPTDLSTLTHLRPAR